MRGVENKIYQMDFRLRVYVSLNLSQTLRIIDSNGIATVNAVKGKREMAGYHHGVSSSSVYLKLGLQQACLASLAEKRRRFLSENINQRAKQPSIWTVRSQLRNQDPTAYEPQLVSIGPFHHGKKELSPMEELKLANLCYILETFSGITLEKYVSEVFALLSLARDEYSENIELPDDKFAEMLVIDGCFLLGFLEVFDPIYNSTFFRQVIGRSSLFWRDLMLIENQIPLLIVRKLFDMLCNEITRDMFSLDIVSAFATLIRSNVPKEKYPRDEDCRHLLHMKYLLLNPELFPEEPPRQSYLQRGKFLENMFVSWIFAPFLGLFHPLFVGGSHNIIYGSKKSRTSSDKIIIPSAIELYESGVKFQRLSIPEQDFGQVVPKASFRDGTLALPWLYVTDSTSSKLRNLIAFEQCFREVIPHFTCYCIFMDYLINTADDVAILRKKGILRNSLGSDFELAEMFNSLCKEIFTDTERDPYEQIYKDVTDFYEIPYNRWRANLSQKYFSNPWTFFSVLAAATLVAFTIIQTFFTIFPRK